MPLIVKDFDWRQTKEHVIINIPLKGVSSSKVDIFTTVDYVKASYSPHLFEVFLFAPVFESNSKCTLTDKEIIFELTKQVLETWPTLTANMNKIEMADKRNSVLELHHSRLEEEKRVKNEKLYELKQVSVRQQIDKDSCIRKIMESRRDTERNVAMEDLENWKKQQILRDVNDDIQDKDEKNILDTRNTSTLSLTHCAVKQNEVPIKCQIPEKQERKLTSRDIPFADIIPIPLPRNCGEITVSFTPRDFPTPSRESQAPQEEEWLRKQMEARRATGFVAEDLRPEECNPGWLKDKGDSFYKVGNFLGAVNAYSHAIKLGSKMAALFSNRAAAHIGLGNCHKALDDCSQALDLMTPQCEANADARAKCYARRGAVLCRLKMPELGLADFEKALELKPNDSTLMKDIEQAKLLITESSKQEDE